MTADSPLFPGSSTFRDGAADTEPVKILLVDDQPENLLSAEAVLESLGQTVIKAESGKEALLQVLDHDFAVIVLDIMMPDMDGLETASLIRRRERSRLTPIIFLTALGRSDEHMLQGYDLGAVDYMTKPFIPEVLRSKVSVFVELRRKSALLERQSALLERSNAELRKAVERSRRAEDEVRALNRALERRIEELDAVNRELEAFSYSVSHDLRGPLSRMAGFSQALVELHASQLDGQGRLYLDRIEKSARRMCDLVEDLLNFSRVTRAPLNEGAVDLTAIVRAIAADLSNREPQRAVEFAIADGVEAWGDAKLLETALCNLLENAWKFTRKRAAPRIEFGVEDRAHPGGAQGPAFFVRDNGAGFDIKEAGRLFSPFQRLHKDAEFEGTGIGLAMVERIIRRHGGRIWAEAEVDRGAGFYFTLGLEGML